MDSIAAFIKSMDEAESANISCTEYEKRLIGLIIFEHYMSKSEQPSKELMLAQAKYLLIKHCIIERYLSEMEVMCGLMSITNPDGSVSVTPEHVRTEAKQAFWNHLNAIVEIIQAN